MNLTLTPEQEQLIQQQLESGKYMNSSEIITEALQLLEKRDRYDQWVEEVGQQIDTAAEQLEQGNWVDGEVALAQLHDRLHHVQSDKAS